MVPGWGRAWGREVAGLGVTAGLVALFAAVMVAFDPGFFWHDDAQSWWVPLMHDVTRALAAGEWPLLTPYSRQMASLAGEYQPGVFSPVVLVGYGLAVGLGGTLAGTAAVYATYSLLVVALGAHTLARLEGVPRPLATMVGLVAALNGWCIGWAATNWYPVVAGFGALMWAWAAMLHALRGEARVAPLAAAGLAVALLVAAGGPHLVVMGAVVTALLVGRACRQAGGVGPAGRATIAWAVGLGLSAPAWVTFLAHLPHTARAGLPLEWRWDRLLPIEALPALVSPAWLVTGFVKPPGQAHLPIELANGLVVTAVLLAALAAADRRAWRVVRWHVGLALLFLVLAGLPGLGMFRWSFRWLLPAHVALALAAACWLAWRWELERRPRPGPTVAGAWDQPAVWGGVALWFVHLGATVVPALYHAVLAGLLAAWVPLEQAARRGLAWARWAPAGLTLATLVVTYRFIPVDLSVPTWPLPPTVQPHPALEPSRRYLLLGELPDFYRPRFADPRHAQVRLIGAFPLLVGLEFVNGYSAVSPLGVHRAFDMDLTGFLAPRAVAFVLERACGPGGVLARIGVDGLVVARPGPAVAARLRAQGWRLVAAPPGGEIWHRAGAPTPLVVALPGWRGVATGDEAALRQALGAQDGLPAVISAAGGGARCASRPLQLLAARRNVIEVEVAPGPHPALVGVMRGWAPAWEARLGGTPLEVVALDGMVPGVLVPAGSGGRLVVSFQPAGLGLGLQLAGATVGLAGVAAFAWRRRRRGDHCAPGVG